MSDGRKATQLASILHTYQITFKFSTVKTDTDTARPVNDARAMRVAEIMTDFRNLQHYLVQLRATPTAEEYYLEGYSLLRQCTTEGQTVLQTPFAASSGAATGEAERERQQLKA